MGPDHPPALPALLPASDLNVVCNRTSNEITISDTAAILRTLTPEDVQLFAVLSGDINPQHPGADSAASTRPHGVIAHGMLGKTPISALLGTRLSGPGTIYLGQTLQFLGPIRVGDTLTIRVTVVSKEDASKWVTLACTCTNDSGTVAITGETEVIAPTEWIERPRIILPDVRVTTGSDGMHRLLDHVRPLGVVRMVIVHPCDALSLTAVMDAYAEGLIVPCLVAPYAKLMRVAADAGFDPSGIEIEDVPHSCAAATRAAELVTQSRAEALMKDSLHTGELMAAIVRDEAGLHTKRRISHCFLMQSPAYSRLSIVTDATINIVPTLNQKAGIVRNVINLAHAIDVERPRVAILAAVETVNPRMPTTLDAAALCKMVDHGQIEGGVLNGPLVFDDAVSAAVARIKGFVSEVAGQADVPTMPDLEGGNMLVKQLEYLGGAANAGIVLGARVPIVLASRADSRESRIVSCVLVTLLAHRYRNLPP